MKWHTRSSRWPFQTIEGCSDSGIVPGANSNLGRTTTHELGHFFNLYHTFQGDSCDEDDGIADTPNIDGNNFGCPADGSIPGCDDQPALTMSYMDYTDDNCMYMFTQGQVDVIEDWLVILESQFKPNVTPVCVEIPEYIISNDTVTACNGLFYDSGGAAEEVPQEIIKIMKISLTLFVLQRLINLCSCLSPNLRLRIISISGMTKYIFRNNEEYLKR